MRSTRGFRRVGWTTLDEFDRTVSTIPAGTLDYLGSLEWVTAKENLCLVGPPGTG
jgi:hypothetical protein